MPRQKPKAPVIQRLDIFKQELDDEKLLYPRAKNRTPKDNLFVYEVCSACEAEAEINRKYVTASGLFICPACGSVELLCSECGQSAKDGNRCADCAPGHINFIQR